MECQQRLLGFWFVPQGYEVAPQREGTLENHWVWGWGEGPEIFGVCYFPGLEGGGEQLLA